MPRIAHVISTPEGIGGAERIVGWLCEGGQERGWDQVVLNPFARDPEHAALRKRIGRASYVGRPAGSMLEVPGLRRWLHGELAAFGPDLVHAHLFHAAVLVGSLPRLRPRVLTHHHGEFLSLHGRRSEARIDRWAGRRFDRVVAVSEWSARLLHGRFGYPPPPVITITNGWGGEPLQRSTAARAPTIVSVGNLRREKGHACLIGAFGFVVTQVPDARLELVGDGPERERLEQLAAERGVAERVTFAGAVEPPWVPLSEADVFALASQVEPLGIAALEAAAAGLPVVAPRLGGLPEVVDDGVTGLLFEPGDERSLAAALIRLLADPPEAAAMGEQGALAAGNRRAADMVHSYFELYEELI